MVAMIWVVLLLPVLFAGASFWLHRTHWTLWLPLVAAVVLLVAGVSFGLSVAANGPLTTADGLFRVDSLSAWMLAVIGAVAIVALWGGLPSRHEGSQPGSFAALLSLFLAAMTLAVVADNLGVLWVAIELTTITTAFLVASRGGAKALEAAWKYVVLGAVGVAIAFLGIALLSAASGLAGPATLSWVGLMARTGQLDPSLVRIAGALAVLGFATKAGLAPMHAWLPDAHSQAPAPVSGLMSGVLLSVATYAILRVQAIVNAVTGPGLMQLLLLVAGLLSLAVAAGLSLTQTDYKRLLAYSSIEHIGLLAIGAAIGSPLALAAVLLHMLGHGLIKASLFVVAGRILAATGSHRIADVRNLLSRRPDLGVPWLLGAAGLLGFPPFVTFFTEVAIVIAGFQAGLGVAMGLVCVLLLIVFAGISRQVLAMSLGVPAAGRPMADGRTPLRRRVPITLALVASALLGFAAWPLADTLAQAVAALGGAR